MLRPGSLRYQLLQHLKCGPAPVDEMSALIERCWERDCYKIMLQSGTRRAGEAHAFYDAIGFDRHAKQAFVIRRP